MNIQSYSQDLRKRVISFLESGHTQQVTSKVFKLSKTTINTWYVRYKKEGHCLPKKNKGASPRIAEEAFTNYISEHPNATTADIGKAFYISASGARYWLKKIGFSYKKKPLPTWKLMKKSEENI